MLVAVYKSLEESNNDDRIEQRSEYGMIIGNLTDYPWSLSELASYDPVGLIDQHCCCLIRKCSSIVTLETVKWCACQARNQGNMSI